MAVFKCKMCGGDLEIIDGRSVAECQYCGSVQTLPKLDDEKRANLYDRANHFRRNNEYDKARGIYEQILNEEPTDAEAYWSVVLCKYGIEYVEDPKTHRRIPTVNRAQFISVSADEDFKSALKYADTEQKKIYKAEAKVVDDIQKGILEISQKEEPFDVFICYKETDNNGRRTPDSVLATELYHELTKEGFKVFFSRITLEDKLGTAYEPYIFAALNSSKAMVVLGTKSEYFNAVWVKNEWSRYLALIKNGAKKTLIPAYRDMDPYDLPEEFSHLQAQDMSKLGFMQDLIFGIKKLINSEKKNDNSTDAQGTNITVFMKRAYLSLENSEWDNAGKYAEDVLNQNPEYAEAYYVKLLAELKITDRNGLRYSKSFVDDKPNYKNALRFANPSFKNYLLKSSEYAHTELQKEAYEVANELLLSDDIEDIVHAKELFSDIIDYKNSKELCEECERKIKQIKDDKIKAENKNKLMKALSIVIPIVTVVTILGIPLGFKVLKPYIAYENAIQDFQNGNYVFAYCYFSQSNYKDSKEYALKSQYEYVKCNYDNKNRTTYEFLKNLKAQNYKDSTELFNSLYKWQITLEYCNTEHNDTETKNHSVNRHTNYFQMGFVLSGGEPNAMITMYHVTHFPNEEPNESTWYWENITSGDSFGLEWEDGFDALGIGTMTIDIYNKEDNSYIGSFSVDIK